jgi:predicted transposase YdaD
MEMIPIFGANRGKSDEDGMKEMWEARRIGFVEGHDAGIEEGAEKTRAEIAEKLKALGVAPEIIAKATS